MIESAADLAAMLADWDCARVGAHRVDGVFDAPASDELETQGYSPTFQCSALAAYTAGIQVGTTISLIITQDGRKLGPWRVAAVESQDDGRMRNLRLEAT